MSNGNPLGRESPAPRHDNQSSETFGQTPWQTIGPFFHYGLPWKGGADLAGQSDLGARPELFPENHYVLNTASAKVNVPGEQIEIFGRVLDAAGAAVSDAMVEIWQANSAGQYAGLAESVANGGFTGFGRAATGEAGEYRFKTIKPGRVPGPGNTLQAPHIAVGVLGRGLLKRLVTRLYFADDHANEEDSVLALVPAERRHTLFANPFPHGTWQFDIHLQGDDETVFFEL